MEHETTMEHFPLSDELVQLLGEIDAEVGKLNAQAQGALVLFMRTHKLQGQWQIAPNRRELVKPASPIPEARP